MAEAHITKTVKVTLELTLREAQILKAMVQNPTSDDEDGETERFRNDIWDTLKDIRPL